MVPSMPTIVRRAAAAAIITAAMATLAGAEQTHPPPGAPDPYTGWRDRAGVSCCNSQDCAPATPCRIDGREGWIYRGTCRPLDPERETPIPPAEVWELGQLHVCCTEQRPPVVPCVLRCWAAARGA